MISKKEIAGLLFDLKEADNYCDQLENEIEFYKQFDLNDRDVREKIADLNDNLNYWSEEYWSILFKIDKIKSNSIND